MKIFKAIAFALMMACTMQAKAFVCDGKLSAGGGGSGAYAGGAGGAGGLITWTAQTWADGSAWSVTIGAGGIPGILVGGTITQIPTNGANSSFENMTSTGGGYGANVQTQAANSGGSGGGGALVLNTAGSGTQPSSGTNGNGAGLGNNGGAGAAAGAGGGGAGGVGGAAGASNGGTAGAGYTWLDGNCTNGGGGGSGRGDLGGSGQSGTCGGGNGDASSTAPSCTAGGANTGGGGGANGYNGGIAGHGAAGGSGFMKWRFITANWSGGTCNSCTVTTSGIYTYWEMDASQSGTFPSASNPTPTWTPTATPTWTPTPSPTWTPTFTATPTWTPTPSPTWTRTTSPTPTWTPTGTPTATRTVTPTFSPTYGVGFCSANAQTFTAGATVLILPITVSCSRYPALIVHIAMPMGNATDYVKSVTFNNQLLSQQASNRDSLTPPGAYGLWTFSKLRPYVGTANLVVTLSNSETALAVVGDIVYSNVGNITNISSRNNLASNSIGGIFFNGTKGGTLSGAMAAYNGFGDIITSGGSPVTNRAITTSMEGDPLLSIDDYQINNPGNTSVIYTNTASDPNVCQFINYMEIVPHP